MEIKDIITLIHEVSESKLTSFTYEENGVKLSFKADRMPKHPPVPEIPPMSAYGMQVMPNNYMFKPQEFHAGTNEDMQVIPETPASEERPEETENFKVITSPMVGTFYSAGKEGDEPFVSVGDYVKKGQIVGIVEAMKLMNEIESPYDGIVAEILVNNKDMIGFGQDIIKIK